ncbi:MAG: NAD-dependent epimerase/dehydratase family protein [Kofleriaceae bacterium]
MRAFITGAAGFIGSTMADRLLSLTVTKSSVTTTSRPAKNGSSSSRFRTTSLSSSRATSSTKHALKKAMSGCDFVFHFAANADVRFGTDHPDRDLQQNTIGTYNVVECDASERDQEDRVLLDRQRLRRSDRVPDAGRRAVSDSDLVLRGGEDGR